MAATGTFTHFFFPHDENLFQDAAIDVLIFRYEIGHQAIPNIPYSVSNGIITFYQENPEKVIIGDLFNVYVGIVSGKDDVYKNTIGNIDVLMDKDRRDKFIYITKYPCADDAINTHLLNHKDELMGRRIRKFGENNWWQWGAPRNIKMIEKDAGAPCIYVRTLSRQKDVAFEGQITYFGGSLLCLVPKSPVDLKKIVAYLNGADFQADYTYAGRFKIGHKQICNATVPA
jgi:adenine-specific DNA-methyltransferase